MLPALVPIALALGAVSLAGSAAGAKSPVKRTFGTRGTIVAIAADGPRVALATSHIAGACDRVVVWNPVAGTFSRYQTQVGCPDSMFKPGLQEVALGGIRVAWVGQAGGNNLDTTVQMSRLGQKKPLDVAFAENGAGAGQDPSGEYLGHLYGSGSVIAYNSWTICDELPAGSDPSAAFSACSTPSSTGRDQYLAQDQKLWTLTNGHRASVGTGVDAQDLVAANEQYLVVAQADEVAVYSAAGKLLRTIPDLGLGAKGDPYQGVGHGWCALSGSSLALVTAAGPRKLGLYDLGTGTLRASVPLVAGESLRGLQGSLAVLVRGRRVRVVDVTSGHKVSFTASGTAPVDAQIDAAGLFYSSTLPHSRGLVVFRPLAQLTQQLH